MYAVHTEQGGSTSDEPSFVPRASVGRGNYQETTSVPVTSEMFLRGTLRALADFQRIHS
jgi:hypothetical protein